ncbi:MAG TPA: prolyl oligopeptidase family serine peptidase [Candidatus Sulfopaludibacter sp.]|nr:prolyl oligopeptidase family serine peptidase [Candidatus Sulfopaludibacter sp.]
MTRKIFLSFSLALFLFEARPAEKFALTVDNIMRGPGLVGYEPAQARWSFDSRNIYFQWKQASDKLDAPMDTYTVGRDGSGLRKLTEEEIKALPPAAGDTTRDKRYMVYSSEGDIKIFDNTTGKIQQVTKTSDAESNPHFLPDGKRIYFTRANNLYVLSLENGSLEQMTDIQAAATPATAAATPAGGRGGGGRGGQGGGRGGRAAAATGDQPPASASQEYLKKEQKDFFETIRERAARKEEDDAKKKAAPPQRKPFTLQARQTANGLQLSPDGKFVTVTVIEAGNAKTNIVPNWITDTGYVEDIPARSNVGDTQSRIRLAVLDAQTGEVKWADHGQGERDVLLSQPVWNEEGTHAVVTGRAADFKDRWIFAFDPATAKLRVITTIHDDAWVGGPGANTLGWMKNDREVFFQSEKTGYSHLYAINWEGGEPRALTSGNWEVLNVRQSKDRSRFFLTASKDSPYENHLYTMDGEGGPLTRITAAVGKHTTTISPDEGWVADIYSYTNKPPELYVQEDKPRAESKKLTTSPTPEFNQYPWLDVPIVEFTARDGVKVPARLFKPANYKKGGPAVVFVHGSGYLQNVDKWWSSSYYHEYMFDHILMERGFLVIDVDYRGSAGYGRDWRTGIYRHMGGKDLDDITDAAKYVVAQYGADPKKIGLWGGSYGGFITLMAMFTQPDVFSAGAALRPVSDWALYNHGYTGEILNLPQSDAEAYKQSSPIFFAEGLKGALLICHGMVDTNVEFEDTVRLVQRLIELRKENWSVAPYPVENHGFIQPTSWADEYKRILALFEKNLK